MPTNAFNPKAKAFVAKPFKFSGVAYNPKDANGDPVIFPHKELKVPDFEMRGLWLADLVDFKSQEEVEEKALLDAEEARIKALVDEEEAELAAAGLPNEKIAPPPPPLTEMPSGTPQRPKAKASGPRQ